MLFAFVRHQFWILVLDTSLSYFSVSSRDTIQIFFRVYATTVAHEHKNAIHRSNFEKYVFVLLSVQLACKSVCRYPKLNSKINFFFFSFQVERICCLRQRISASILFYFSLFFFIFLYHGT